MSENRKIDEDFRPSKREVCFTNDALNELDSFSSLVERYINFYACRVAEDRVYQSDNPEGEITVGHGDIVEAVDNLRYLFGEEFFELTEGKWGSLTEPL